MQILVEFEEQEHRGYALRYVYTYVRGYVVVFVGRILGPAILAIPDIFIAK